MEIAILVLVVINLLYNITTFGVLCNVEKNTQY